MRASLLGSLGLLLLGLPGCNTGSSGPKAMSINACSLGCSSGGFAGQISCSISDVFVNQEIRVAFNGPIDLSSVTNNSFSVVQAGTGATPPGSFSLDPSDNRVLIYRPLLTFDSSGNPSFGFKEDATYTIRMPGTNNSVGPYVRSQLGAANQTTLECVVVASRGVFDVKTGAPTVKVFVDTIDGMGGVNEMRDVEDPAEVDPNMPEVSRKTSITMEFDDIMNPATLVNPVTGVASNVTVKVDADGNVAGTADQVTIPGRFSIALDQTRLTTTVVFTPDGDLPSAGNDPLNPRRIVVTLPATILDLGDNPIQAPRSISFTPEEVGFPAASIVESFQNTINEDAGRSGNRWAVGGALEPGVGGGGSGRLGELTIPSGQTVVLSTDPAGEDFSGITNPTIFNPFNALEPTVFGEIDPITDAVFEFSRLRIDAGGALRFEGPQAPRVYVRGEAVIQGTVDVAGKSALTHDSEELDGGLGGEPGPAGGAGGDGGDRSDGSAFILEDGVENPNMPVLYEDVDGKPGGGIPEPDSLMPNSLVAGGEGGLAWPQPTADFPDFHFPEDITDVSGMQFEKKQFCRNRIPGGAGGGGGHAFDGLDGVASLVPITGIGNDPADPPPDAMGGDVTDLMIDDTVKSLDPELGLLRGGGGGGGGGGHLQESAVNGQLLVDCTMPISGTLVIIEYRHHSSAGGGGGGGGIQIQTGRRMVVDGIIDASGGNGGGNQSGRRAQSGGAGAGGSVLLQAPSLTIKEVPGRIDVSGGDGGIGVNNSMAGDASPGFVRLESIGEAPDPAEEGPKISPTEARIASDFGGVLSDVLTTAVWTPDATVVLGRDNFSGAQSCWLRPDVTDADAFIFELEFFEDGMAPTADGLGWDMLLRVDGFANLQSFRGDNDLFGTPIDDPGNWGNELGASPVVVRFQGARALGPLPDACNAVLAGTQSQIFPGSLTGWVSHPAELNDFFGGDDPVLQPNIFRFQVIFDASDANFGAVEGIAEIRVPTQPD